MAAKARLSVEVQGDDIVVTLPDTVVTYCRAAVFPQQQLPNPTTPSPPPIRVVARPDCLCDQLIRIPPPPLARFGMSRYHSPH
jgi:hypothetical protein